MEVVTTMEHILHCHIDMRCLLKTVSIHIVHKTGSVWLKAYTNPSKVGYIRNIRLRRLIYFCSNFHASYCLLIFSNISAIFTQKQLTPPQTSSRRILGYFRESSWWEFIRQIGPLPQHYILKVYIHIL